MIRFTSAAAASVTMLDAHATELLRLAGRIPAPRGAIAAEEVGAALAALRSAVTGAPVAPEPADADSSPEVREQQAMHVDLSQRAFPLLDMLERAANKNKPVLWEQG